MSSSLKSQGLQNARLSCPLPSPRVCSNSCPLNWWFQVQWDYCTGQKRKITYKGKKILLCASHSVLIALQSYLIYTYDISLLFPFFKFKYLYRGEIEAHRVYVIWKPIFLSHPNSSLSRELNSSMDFSYCFHRCFLDQPGPRWFLLFQSFSGTYHPYFQFHTYSFMQGWLYLTHLLICKHLLNSHHEAPLGSGDPQINETQSLPSRVKI